MAAMMLLLSLAIGGLMVSILGVVSLVQKRKTSTRY
jgi:hypothetical protein